jgi:hypothetical protein
VRGSRDYATLLLPEREGAKRFAPTATLLASCCLFERTHFKSTDAILLAFVLLLDVSKTGSAGAERLFCLV